MFDEEYFENLYSQSHDPWNRELRISLIEYEKRYLDIIRQHILLASRILEVACGTGYFAAQLVDTYPNAEVQGCDISLTAVRIARERHGSQVGFFVSKMPELQGVIGEFDLIVVNEALAYLNKHDRNAAIERLHSLTGRNGYLFISSNLGPAYFDVEALTQLVESHYGTILYSVLNYGKQYHFLFEIPMLEIHTRLLRATHKYVLLTLPLRLAARFIQVLIKSRFLMFAMQAVSKWVLGYSAASHIYILAVRDGR